MDVQVISREKQQSSHWSGGTTTELFLWPPDGSYKKRDFLCRVSTAVCLDRESVFTVLPDTDRILAIIDGEICLRHDGGKWYTLRPGMQTSFSGAAKTESRGTCVDFNVMMRGGTRGTVRYIKLARGEEAKFEADGDFMILYAAAGEISITGLSEPVSLREHDVCRVTFPEKGTGQQPEDLPCFRAEALTESVLMAA